MTSLDVEGTIIADLRALLTVAALTAHWPDATVQAAPTLPGLAVSVQQLADDLPGGQGPSGFCRAAVMLDTETDVDDDPAATAAGLLVKAVRTVIMQDDLIARLNAVSSAATYYGWQRGTDIQTVEGRIRHLGVSLTLVLRPSNATTTTTSTTTT